MAEEILRVPNHVAIIPDGNRRWARARGLKPWDGHDAGAKNTEQLVREARRLGIKELSFWGSSISNLLKRPIEEKLALLRIYEQGFSDLIGGEDIFRDRVRLRFIGRWREQFPVSLCSLLEDAERKTASHDAYFLNFFLAYSGTDDMLSAFRSVAETPLSPDSVDERFLKSRLMTAELPPVDLLIRTGGEAHLSAGFLMWDTAESQLFFSELMYPDFGSDAFRGAIEEYGNRERRLGK